jgi:calmodulin
MGALSNEEIEACREAFARFDKDSSGAIDMWELRATLQSMGQEPSDEELFDMIAEVDTDGSGEIDFPEFLKVISSQKSKLANQDDESDTVDAFIALGGNADKTGEISTEKLRGIVKEFGLTIDIDVRRLPSARATSPARPAGPRAHAASSAAPQRLIRETDKDHSGFIDYPEFKDMMAE